MEIKIQSCEQLGKLLDALALEIVDANIYHRLFCGIVDSISGHHREFSQSNTFWSLTISAIRDARIFRLCRVYDQESSSLNLVNLLDTIKENRKYFEAHHFRERLKNNAFVDSLAEDIRVPSLEELDADIDFASNRNPLVKKLMLWRNNIVAHRGAKISLGKNAILADNPISLEEMESLLTKGMSIFNRYSNLYCASTWSCKIVGHDDYKSLLKFISLGLQKWDEEIERQLEVIRKCQQEN